MIPAHYSRNLVATQGIYFAVPSTFSKHGVYFLRCATNSKEELLNSFLFIHALKNMDYGHLPPLRRLGHRIPCH